MKTSPFHSDGDGGPEPLDDGIAFCLSGGGYRAMLFHLGGIWRLSELGLLPKLTRISSVSGGSIAAATLGLAWKDLAFDRDGVARRLQPLVVEPLRKLAGTTIDTVSIFHGLFLPGRITRSLVAAYRRRLFGGNTLQVLPSEPQFIFNATNVQSKALWRFSRAYMGDYRVGLVENPRVELAVAVAASAAFPPYLSPIELPLQPGELVPGSGTDLQRPPFDQLVFLTDGGVYDNLGLETVWKRTKTILVSDGGSEIRDEPNPDRDWARHSYRVFNLIDHQVRSLRKRQVIEAYRQGLRHGAYWGIHTDIAGYGLDNAVPFPREESLRLANTPTRLRALPAALQERIINWGYAVCDAALRAHVDPALPPPCCLPY